MANTYRIALYPGDGIGPEVVEATCAVVDAVESRIGGFHLEYQRFDWGIAYFDRHGRVAPDDFLDTLRGFDAIFLGAVGWPARLPDHVTLAPLIRLRQAFDLYACVRPARTFAGVAHPLRTQQPIDLVVVRENSEGEYVDNGGVLASGTPDEVAVQSALHTRRGVERILRFSFELARTRRRRLAMITKSNAQRFAYVLWDRILSELSPQYADVATEKLHIDAATLELVRRPHTFDVIVGSNLFGDILSDLTGGITGSLGLNPSANLDPQRRSPSLFEPVHGSAPDIAGKGIANPTGAVLSAAMMLDWLGEASAAATVRRAVERALAAGHLTPDVGGTLTTAEMTKRIAEQLAT
jgi:tartrate dehydrogenase/decarboxylase/D-malate dehydrogenase